MGGKLLSNTTFFLVSMRWHKSKSIYYRIGYRCTPDDCLLIYALNDLLYKVEKKKILTISNQSIGHTVLANFSTFAIMLTSRIAMFICIFTDNFSGRPDNFPYRNEKNNTYK